MVFRYLPLGRSSLAAGGHNRRSLALGVYQIVENALARHQFLVRTNFGYFARVEDHEAIRAAQGREPVGNGEGGAAFDEPLNSLLDLLLGRRVERRSRLV